MKSFHKDYIFTSTSSAYDEFSGQSCTIIRKLNKDEVDEEVGDMYEIEFNDGQRIHVFTDELSSS